MLWLSYVFKKHDITLANMPFNALEFGNLILQEKGLSNVKIEKTLNVDHYDLTQKKVRVVEDRLNKKSLTALSIVCHEIGHAIQHQENYKPLEQRTTLVKNTQWISSLGSGIMFMGIPTIMALGSYSFIKICLLIVLLSNFIFFSDAEIPGYWSKRKTVFLSAFSLSKHIEIKYLQLSYCIENFVTTGMHRRHRSQTTYGRGHSLAWTSVDSTMH